MSSTVQAAVMPVIAAEVVAPRAVRASTKKVTTPTQAAAKPVVQLSATTATKATTKAKTVAKPVPKAEAKATMVPDVKLKADKLLKDKKPKLVRDSFTIPKLEYLILDQLKQRSGTLGTFAKKSELTRAGIKALAEMPDASFLAAVRAVPTIKTGRPLKD